MRNFSLCYTAVRTESRLHFYLLQSFFKIGASLGLNLLLVVASLEIFLISVFSDSLSMARNMARSECMSAEKQVGTITLKQYGFLTLDD